MPGVLLHRILRLRHSPDWLVTLALQLGLGLAFLPVLFLWTSTLGLHWSAQTVTIFAQVMGFTGLAALLVAPLHRWQWRLRYLRRNAIWLTGFVILLGLTLITRQLHLRGLILPAWVDSVHHVMIARLLVEHGALVETYDPYIAGGQFYYHWGFHALLAWVSLAAGSLDGLTIARRMMLLGQAFNTLSLLMLYAGGRTLLQSRRAGLMTAMLGALVSWLPAYYLSWGRYPQLVGLLLLAPLGIVLWRVHRRMSAGEAFAAVLLASGLFLMHSRVTFFALTLFLTIALALRSWPTLVRWTAIALTSGLVLFPWLIRLTGNLRLQRFLSPGDATTRLWWSDYNAIPWDLVWLPRNQELLAVATAGMSTLIRWDTSSIWLRVMSVGWMLIVIAISAQAWRRRTLTVSVRNLLRVDGLLLGWCLITLILLNLNLLGLPPIRFVHNSSAVIALFIPLSLAGAALLVYCLKIFTDSVKLRPYKSIISVLVAVLIGGVGAYSMRDIVNRDTLLVGTADIRVMHWIEENTPLTAKFAISTRPWVRETHRGIDGGYWITVLTDRTSILPPALYPLALSREESARINTFARRWNNADAMDDRSLRQLLRDAEVTHVYVGEKGDQSQVDSMLGRSFMELVHRDGLVHIFAVK